jgi:hypothetical protein
MMMWRQGDVFIERVEQIPAATRDAPLPHGVLVHGEITGHSHRVEDLSTAQLFSGGSPGEVFLDVIAPLATIIHEEHGPIRLEHGTYRVWRQREYSPKAIRLVYD